MTKWPASAGASPSSCQCVPRASCDSGETSELDKHLRRYPYARPWKTGRWHAWPHRASLVAFPSSQIHAVRHTSTGCPFVRGRFGLVASLRFQPPGFVSSSQLRSYRACERSPVLEPCFLTLALSRTRVSKVVVLGLGGVWWMLKLDVCSVCLLCGM